MAMLSPRLQRQLQTRLSNTHIQYGSHDNQSVDSDNSSDARSTGYEVDDITHEDDINRGDITYQGIIDDTGSHGYGEEGGVASSGRSDRAGYVYVSSGLPRQMSEDDARSNASIIDL